MEYILYFFVFIIGASFGSFLNVVIDRPPKKLSVINDRSICESCNKKLKWFDMFPVFSYIILLGKCRYCHSKIPKRVLLVEVLTGIVFTYLFSVLFMGTINLIIFILSVPILFCFIVIFFTDLKYGIIPDEALIILFFLVLIINLLFNNHFIITYIISGFSSFAFFLILYLLTRGKGMGFGDVKFSFLIGFMLGFPNTVLAFYLAFLTGAFVSIILVLLGKKKFRHDTIPFGPFLIIGILLTYLLGDSILKIIEIW